MDNWRKKPIYQRIPINAIPQSIEYHLTKCYTIFDLLTLYCWFPMKNKLLAWIKPFAIFDLAIAILVYYGICLVFGTQELRTDVMPTFIKCWFSRKNSV